MIAQGTRCLAVGAVIAIVASAGSAAPIIIDTFDSGSLSDAIFGYTSRTKDEAAAGIIDGWRQVTVSGLGSGGGGGGPPFQPPRDLPAGLLGGGGRGRRGRKDQSERERGEEGRIA